MGFSARRRRLIKFSLLSHLDKQLLIEAVLLLGITRIGLTLVPFSTFRNLAAKVTGGGFSAVGPAIQRIAWAITTAARYSPGKNTCLAQALAAQILLRRWGHPSELRIGVTKNDFGNFQAHAWLESGGMVVIGGAGLERYVPLPVLT